MLLSRTQADTWLGAATGHVAVPVRQASQARLLWLNTRAAALDPEFARLGRDARCYGEHLLEHCAWLVAEPGEAAEGWGHADRYGGSGIGHNGGSGRALTLHGYHVKGVGRTPLVSELTPRSHAAGGAYLEEAVRETIFAEIVDRGFPHGAVPTLALIDLGLVQDWHTDWPPRRERRVLLVRPAFLRPAHFERAAGLVSGDGREARRDVERVAAMCAALQGHGGATLAARFEALWPRWAEQLAHGFVFQLGHGNNTSSNITLDGRLLDFGAATALPSWARVASTRWHQGVGEHFGDLAAAIRSLGHHLGQQAAITDAQLQRAAQHYRQGLCRALLRRVGLGNRLDTAYAPGTAAGLRLQRLLARVLAHFDAECLDMLEHTPQPRLAMGWAGFWQPDGAPHWRELRAELAAALGPEELPQAVPGPGDEAWRQLCFPELKRALFAAVDASEQGGPAPAPDGVAAVIDRHVDIGLRQMGVDARPLC